MASLLSPANLGLTLLLLTGCISNLSLSRAPEKDRRWNRENNYFRTNIQSKFPKSKANHKGSLIVGNTVKKCHSLPINGRKICFFSNQASERGTEISLFDYADYAEVLLGVNSMIIFPRSILRAAYEHRSSLHKFESRFPNKVFFCGENSTGSETCNDLSYIAKDKAKCDLLYVTKFGTLSSVPTYPSAFNSSIPTAIHAVFKWEIHGAAYAAISPYLSDMCRGCDVVPYIVRPPDMNSILTVNDLRGELNLPPNSLVICRHGGEHTFNIQYVQQGVFMLLLKYNFSQLHFVFLNTKPFLSTLQDYAGEYFNETGLWAEFRRVSTNATGQNPDPHVRIRMQTHFLEPTSSDSFKERYFKTCDAMLHARRDGETFGMAVAEFSVRNKPVITQSKGKQIYIPAHVSILKEKGLYYSDNASLIAIIDNMIAKKTLIRHLSINHQELLVDGDLNAYRDYYPMPVMQKFKEIFWDPIFTTCK